MKRKFIDDYTRTIIEYDFCENKIILPQSLKHINEKNHKVFLALMSFIKDTRDPIRGQKYVVYSKLYRKEEY